MKKIISVLWAIILTVSMSIPTFAAYNLNEADEGSTVIGAYIFTDGKLTMQRVIDAARTIPVNMPSVIYQKNYFSAGGLGWDNVISGTAVPIVNAIDLPNDQIIMYENDGLISAPTISDGTPITINFESSNTPAQSVDIGGKVTISSGNAVKSIEIQLTKSVELGENVSVTITKQNGDTIENYASVTVKSDDKKTLIITPNEAYKEIIGDGGTYTYEIVGGVFDANGNNLNPATFILLFEKVVDSPFTLNVSNDTILIGKDSNSLFFYLSTNLDVASISLYEQSVEVAKMYDDGNYASHGDDMAGDGIYSAIYQNVATSDTNIVFTARYNNEQSNPVSVKVYTSIQDMTIDSMQIVDSSIENVIMDDSFLAATEEEKQELIENKLEELVTNGKIIENSIAYNDEAGVFSFQYSGEILGGVMIRDFTSDLNSAIPNTEDMDNPDNFILESSQYVELLFNEVVASEEYVNATEDERKQMVIKILEKLSENGIIILDSISYNEETGAFSFLYVDGTLSSVEIRELNDKLNVAEVNNKDNNVSDNSMSESTQNVNFKLEEIVESGAFINATEDERKQIVIEAIDILSKNGIIILDSISYNEEAGIFSFQYADGTLGGVMVRDFNSAFNDFESYTIETDVSQTTLSYEEKQLLWKERENMSNTSVDALETMIAPFTNSEDEVAEIGNAIILNAFPAFETEAADIAYRTKFYVDLKAEWDGKGLQTNLDTTVTVDDFKNLINYDVICISSHGSTYNSTPVICLAEKSTTAKDKTYSVELKDKQIAKVTTTGGSTCYWILPSLIEKSYTSSGLDGSFVFSECCEFKGNGGTVNNSMSDAFESRSADVVVGFHNSVLATYSRNFMKSYIDSLITGATAQVAFNAAISEHGGNHKIWYESNYTAPYITINKVFRPDYPVAYPILSGQTTATLVQTGIRNGDFSSTLDLLIGIPAYWNREGDVRSIAQLGEIKPQGLNNPRMAIVTTGIGSKSSATISSGTEGSILSQKFVVPEDATTISFEYDFVSEEPMEFVGSKYDDSFILQLKQGTTVVIEESYESINTSNWIEVKGVDFAGGDQTAYHTGWKSATIDVSDYQGTLVTLNFIIYDVGDSIYDSACLIDNVKVE